MIHYNLLLLSKYRSALMGIAMLWVMSFHLSPIRTYLPIIGSVSNIGYSGVDIFLFLSGFGLYYSLSNKDISFSEYYKRRFYRIFPEFWLFLLCTFIISMNFDLKSVCELLCCASTIGYWVGLPYFLWFISCYVFFSFAYPLYYKQFKRYGIIVPICYILIGFVFTVLYGIVSVSYFNNSSGPLPLSLSRIPIFIIGSLFGFVTKEQIDSKSSIRLISLFVFLMPLAIIVLFISFKFFSAYLWSCSLYWIPFIFITPSLCVFLSSLLDRTPRIVNIILSWVGNHSLELYIVHQYLKDQFLEWLESYLDRNIIGLLVLLVSFLLAIALKRFSNVIIKRFVA